MKVNVKIAVFGLILLLATVVGYAVKKSHLSISHNVTKNTPITTKALSSSGKAFFLYSKADLNSSKTPISLSRLSYAVDYFRHPGWFKVGFSDDGQTGWVNRAELEKALSNGSDQHALQNDSI